LFITWLSFDNLVCVVEFYGVDVVYNIEVVAAVDFQVDIRQFRRHVCS